MGNILYPSREEKLLLSVENPMKKMSRQMFCGDHCMYIVSRRFYLWFTTKIIIWWLFLRYFTWWLIIRISWRLLREIIMEILHVLINHKDIYHENHYWYYHVAYPWRLLWRFLMEILKIFHRDFSGRSPMKIFIEINYGDLS